MSAAKLNLVLEQGATFVKNLTWKDVEGTPIDLTGYTAQMHIRATKESSTVLVDLNTTNSRIILGGVLGTIDLNIDVTTTTAITWTKGVYDLELTALTGVVTRLVEGKIKVSFQVTR